MKKCIHCGAQIADDSRFCSECGKEIMQANVCPHCGASVGEGDAFCQNCGKSLNEAPSSEPITYEEELPKSGFKKCLPYIIGAIILVAICGGGWWYYNLSKTTDSKNDIAATDTIAADTVAADVTPKQQVKNIYMNLISENNASQYYLADLSGDGVPELLLKKCLTSSCFVDIYTVYNNKTIQLLGIGSGGDDNVYIGKNYIIALSAGDDYCVWRKYAFKKYEETSMVEDVIYKGYLEENENFYKEPTEPLLDWNDISNKELFTQWNM